MTGPSLTFGQRLRQLREQAKVGPVTIALALGIELATYEAWERDELEPLTRLLLPLAEALGVDLHTLADLPPQPPSAALLEFLETELGQLARAHGFVRWLRDLRTLRPPTVKLYTDLTRALLAPDVGVDA